MSASTHSGGLVGRDSLPFTMQALCFACKRALDGIPWRRGEIWFCRNCAEKHGIPPA